MKILLLLTLCLDTFKAIPTNPQRIVGGSLTTIENYPFSAALLFGSGNRFTQLCAGSIINFRSVLSAAHCFDSSQYSMWRIRVGSTYANSGGFIHNVNRITIHPSFNANTYDSDIAVLRIAGNFAFTNNVTFGRFPAANYHVPDDANVWAIGWGRIAPNGELSEQLRHVQIQVVDQTTCSKRYAEIGRTITLNMLCAGSITVEGRDQCQGDSGGPLIHNNAIVGVYSWGESCGLARFPGVNARVTRFISWIFINS